MTISTLTTHLTLDSIAVEPLLSILGMMSSKYFDTELCIMGIDCRILHVAVQVPDEKNYSD
jgi:hypothetical protein